MTTYVVDTNVAMAANGRETHADLGCRLSCVQRLNAVVTEETIAIDDTGLIFEEYARRLSRSGQPGVGDAFLKYLFDHQYHGARIRRVTVTRSANPRRVSKNCRRTGSTVRTGSFSRSLSSRRRSS